MLHHKYVSLGDDPGYYVGEELDIEHQEGCKFSTIFELEIGANQMSVEECGPDKKKGHGCLR